LVPPIFYLVGIQKANPVGADSRNNDDASFGALETFNGVNQNAGIFVLASMLQFFNLHREKGRIEVVKMY
jgi:hypothetical protein